MTDPRDYALRYLALGFAVLPVNSIVDRDGRRTCACGHSDCAAPGKHPVARLAPNGVKNATSDPATVERWFASKNSLNIGIATGKISGIFALDIDPRHGGNETLAALEQQYGPLPNTWRFLTGGGGEHILFRHPGSIIPNSINVFGPGIDLRGDNGYIVAPPSLHMCGRRYAIPDGHRPESTPLADPSDWLLARLCGSGCSTVSKKSPTDWRSLTSNYVEAGSRNDTIARLAGMLIGRGVNPHVCLDLVLAFNASKCVPPLSEFEVMRTVASIAQRDSRRRPNRR